MCQPDTIPSVTLLANVTPVMPTNVRSGKVQEGMRVRVLGFRQLGGISQQW